MSENVSEVIDRRHAFYEVLPYYVAIEDRPPGAPPVTRRVQAGYDIDVYESRTSQAPGPSSNYGLVYDALQELTETVARHTSDHCSIEVIPFGSTIVLDTSRRLEPESMLRIRISHGRGLDQPAGGPEMRALKEIEEQLHKLGISPGKGRA